MVFIVCVKFSTFEMPVSHFARTSQLYLWNFAFNEKWVSSRRKYFSYLDSDKIHLIYKRLLF